MNLLHLRDYRTMVRFFYTVIQTLTLMATTDRKKPGPKDREYVNKSQDHEVKHEPKRKTPAKKFGGKK
jgi:hypothetical protein